MHAERFFVSARFDGRLSTELLKGVFQKEEYVKPESVFL